MKDKTKNLRRNNILPIPPLLVDLYKIREKLGDTDRTDHLQEVQAQENKAKEAILKLSALDNEGVKLLVKLAKDELKDISAKLNVAPMTKLGVITDPPTYTFRQQCLFNQRDLWLFFLNFFGEAENAHKEVEQFVKEQSDPEPEIEY